MKAALGNLKVVELGTLIAGPYCARLLAEFGAEVIKIETPGEGDPLRKWRRLHEGSSLWWYAQARGRASARSANRWAACATSPDIPTARRCAWACRSAIRSRRCSASSARSRR
jgi:hypothetical protein